MSRGGGCGQRVCDPHVEVLMCMKMGQCVRIIQNALPEMEKQSFA